MTTTDNFTSAAMTHLAEVDHDKSRDWFDGFVACVSWARDHLAAQEPTDAEVEAVKDIMRSVGSDDLDVLARQALSAARAVRRDEGER